MWGPLVELTRNDPELTVSYSIFLFNRTLPIAVLLSLLKMSNQNRPQRHTHVSSVMSNLCSSATCRPTMLSTCPPVAVERHVFSVHCVKRVFLTAATGTDTCECTPEICTRHVTCVVRLLCTRATCNDIISRTATKSLINVQSVIRALLSSANSSDTWLSME